MQSDDVKIEVRIGQKMFTLVCDKTAQIWEMKEALFQFTKYLGKIEDAEFERITAEQAAKEQEKPAEELPI